MPQRDEPTFDAAGLIRFGAVGQARRRLFCLPFAGGGPSTYRLWPAAMPSDIEVVVIVLPGRDPRARLAPGVPPPGTMPELVPSVLAAVADRHASQPLPFAIFGHSMGALVAFEVTVALEAIDMAPDHLFVSGRRPPDELHNGERIHDLPEVEFLDRMQERYGGVPAVVRNEPDLLQLLLPALRADVQVFESYAPLTDRSVRCPLRVYGGNFDTRPRPEALGGWQRVAERPISIRTFDGDHFYLNQHVDALADDVAHHWQQAIDQDPAVVTVSP